MTNLQTKPSNSSFITQNQQELAELLTFLDFAQGLTIAFVEVNQAYDRDLLTAFLREQTDGTDIHLEVMNFSQEPDLRFLKDALEQRLETARQRVPVDKKLVLWIQGLEQAIGTDGIGAYPPILQDLNFVRDAYRHSVPYPLLFVLPDYAITRVSHYAPDFWAWKSGLFRFKTADQSVEQLKTNTFEQPLPLIASSENQSHIDQLKQLLMELNPSGQNIADENVLVCSELYYKLGSAYLTQRRPHRAKDYLLEGLKLLDRHPNEVLGQDLYRKLGHAYEQMRQFEAAANAYNIALESAKSQERPVMVSRLLSDLGDVALKQRQFDRAREFYQRSLTLDEARGDRYKQASTYHQLGRVAQALREYVQAQQHYQQALDIKIEFGDRYSQARTYGQLGLLAEAQDNYAQARQHLQMALEIFVELNDQHSVAITVRNLACVYGATQDTDMLADVAQCLNSSVEEVLQLFASLTESQDN